MQSMHEHVISAGAMNIAAALINQGRRYKRGHFSLLASYNNNLKITPKAATFKKKLLLVPVGATNRDQRPP